MQMVIGEQGLPLDGLLLKSVGRWKRGLLSVAALLAVTGISLAQERDPRLKDPTIDFDTVKLATLRPLQFTFVPEWRNLEGFRRFVFGKPLRRWASPGQETMCEAFWSALQTGSDTIKVVEPIIQTNLIRDLETSPLKPMCPQYDPEYGDETPTSKNAERWKIRFGAKLYDVSEGGAGAYVYEFGRFGDRLDPTLINDDVSRFNELLKDRSTVGKRQFNSWIYFRQDQCKPRQIGAGVSFMLVDNINDGGVFHDNIIVRFQDGFYSLQVSDRVENGRDVELTELKASEMRPPGTPCHMYN